MEQAIPSHKATAVASKGGHLLAMQIQRWRVLFSLICLAVLAVGLYRQIVPQQWQGPDFINAYDAAVQVRDGHNPYAAAAAWINNYKPGDPLENHLDFFTYAPTYALFLVPLTFLPYQVALTLWGICISAFLFLSVYASLRCAGARPSVLGLLLLVTAASLTSAVRAEYWLGQANLFMLACVCAAVWAGQAHRPGLAGLLLALVFVTKPTFLILALFLLWKREFKLVFVSLTAFAVLLVLPFVWLGSQAGADLLVVWHFFSSQYLTFSENISLRGMLERMFTLNPFVRPVAVFPGLTNLLWLGTVALLLLMTLALIAPRPLQRDKRSMLEVGMIISAVLLVSPLTEPPYLVFLILPLIASITYLHSPEMARTGLRFGWASVVVLAVWLLLLVPRNFYEPFLWTRAHGDSFMASVFATLGPSHFYILVIVFVLQLHVLSRASGMTASVALSNLVRNSPRLALDWLGDLACALKIAPSPLSSGPVEPIS